MGLNELVNVLDPRRIVRGRDTHIKSSLMEPDRDLSRFQYERLRLYINALRETKINESLRTEERFSLGWVNNYGMSQAHRLDAEKIAEKIDDMVAEDSSLKQVADKAWAKQGAHGNTEKTRLESILDLNDTSTYQNTSERLLALTDYIAHGGEDLSLAQYYRLKKVASSFKEKVEAAETSQEVGERLKSLKHYMAREYYKLKKDAKKNVLEEVRSAKQAKEAKQAEAYHPAEKQKRAEVAVVKKGLEGKTKEMHVEITLKVDGVKYTGQGTVHPEGYSPPETQEEEITNKSPSSLGRLRRGITNWVKGRFTRTPDPDYVSDLVEDLYEASTSSDAALRVGHTVSKMTGIAKKLPDAALPLEEAKKVAHAYKKLSSYDGRIDLAVARHEYDKTRDKLKSILDKTAFEYQGRRQDAA